MLSYLRAYEKDRGTLRCPLFYGITKSFLKEEYHLALKSIESPPCDVGNCTRCGVCN